MMRPSPPSPSVVTRFTMPLPQGQQFSNTGRQIVDVSRDGSQLVYVANQRLYLRGMGNLEPRLAWTSIQGWSKDNVPRLGASLAYYTLFAVSPFLVIVIAIAGSAFGEEAVRGQIVTALDDFQARPLGGGTDAELLERLVRVRPAE